MPAVGGVKQLTGDPFWESIGEEEGQKKDIADGGGCQGRDCSGRATPHASALRLSRPTQRLPNRHRSWARAEPAPLPPASREPVRVRLASATPARRTAAAAARPRLGRSPPGPSSPASRVLPRASLRAYGPPAPVHCRCLVRAHLARQPSAPPGPARLAPAAASAASLRSGARAWSHAPLLPLPPARLLRPTPRRPSAWWRR
jgi:hypothetical protein